MSEESYRTAQRARESDEITVILLAVLGFLHDHQEEHGRASDELRRDAQDLYDSLVDFTSGYDERAYRRWVERRDGPPVSERLSDREHIVVIERDLLEAEAERDDLQQQLAAAQERIAQRESKARFYSERWNRVSNQLAAAQERIAALEAENKCAWASAKRLEDRVLEREGL